MGVASVIGWLRLAVMLTGTIQFACEIARDVRSIPGFRRIGKAERATSEPGCWRQIEMAGSTAAVTLSALANGARIQSIE
jgi:hypothetical protein